MHKKAIQIGKTLGPYTPALVISTKEQQTLFSSGQIALDPTTGEIVSHEFSDQARQVFENIQILLDESNFDFADIVKLTIFLVDLKYFGEVNDLCKKFFSEPYPARSTVQVVALPKDALLEIEFVGIKKSE